MVGPCDCPSGPAGGMGRRATMIQRLREKGDVLLLSAGGFAAGGIYDSYTQGREGDSLRTLRAIEAMARIGYDAVGVGDDDLQYGARWLSRGAQQKGLTLVCANYEPGGGQAPFPKSVIVKKGEVRFGITAVTTPERLFPLDTSFRVRDPIGSLRKLWPDLCEKSDVQIILSHCGESVSMALADSFPECDLIVNGHRKRSTGPALSHGDTPILQFGYQGKSLSRIRYDKEPGSSGTFGKARWMHVERHIPVDSTILRVAGDLEEKAGAPVYDLYIMSQCPYGLQALGEFIPFVERFDGLEWAVWFVGSIDSDSSLSSLHGSQEVRDEQTWLAVQALYPDMWPEFLRLVALQGVSTKSAVDDMGLDSAALGRWVERSGERELRTHYARSTRLGVDASPTLLVRNTPVQHRITAERLAWGACREVDNTYCDSLPECLEDSDCRREGKIGECSKRDGERRCVFHDAVDFAFIVVAGRKDATIGEREAVATTRELFPGAKIERVQHSSLRGRKLLSRVPVDALPLFLFEKKVATARNFGKIESGLVERGGFFTFRQGIMRPTYYHRRPLKRGATQVFLDPFATGAREALRKVLHSTTTIIPVIYEDPAEPASSSEERLRREEAQRWLVLARKHPRKFRGYLTAYTENTATSYWFRALRDLDIAVDVFVEDVESDTSSLADLWARLNLLDIREPVAVLKDNRELLTGVKARDWAESEN